MLVQKDSLRRVVELCKAEGKGVVIGGPYVTTGAEHLPQADQSSSARPDDLAGVHSRLTAERNPWILMNWK